jgi:hypothetical protein
MLIFCNDTTLRFRSSKNPVIRYLIVEFLEKIIRVELFKYIIPHDLPKNRGKGKTIQRE